MESPACRLNGAGAGADAGVLAPVIEGRNCHLV